LIGDGGGPLWLGLGGYGFVTDWRPVYTSIYGLFLHVEVYNGELSLNVQDG